jgi:hypothetical protein
MLWPAPLHDSREAKQGQRVWLKFRYISATVGADRRQSVGGSGSAIKYHRSGQVRSGQVRSGIFHLT